MRNFSRILFFIFCIYTPVSIAQRGIDGNRVIAAAGTIVNEYTTLTADAAIGATTITVGASGLNANVRFGAGNNLAAGDLIMIIQMQGISSSTSSSIEFPAGSGQFYGFPNDLTWGQTTSYNNCGNYEFCQVRSVPSGTSITIDCGLKNAYTSAGRVQVIRVPRYNTLTINSGGVLTCPAWAAGGIFTGGIVAIEVYGATMINGTGTINVNGLGFRGGSRVGDNVTTLGGGQVSRNSPNEGAEKGEGVFGYQADYNVIGGRYCRGVAGNGGGGADGHNSGGGGGSNAGLGIWDGEGNPDVSGGAGWVAAWNLEVTPSFATHVSSGGGRGGYSFSSANRNATIEGPRPFQTSGTNLWNGDYRSNNGGWGGRPLDYSTGKIFLGGGGGSGDQENNCGGSGGAGGGMVYVLSYGTIGTTGGGTIVANGAAGSNTTSSGASFGIDGAGGAGGGGTIILNSVGTISGITASANGGNGGNQDVLPLVNEAEGPGGGGGGGYIAISTGVITATVNGGANGTTDSNGLTEFPPNGATRGGPGLTNQPISTDTITVANQTICSGNTATLTATLVGGIPATITWYSAQVAGTVLGTGPTFTTPVLATTTTYYVGFCPGTYTIPVTVTVNTSPTTSAAGGDQTVCATSATLAGNAATAGTGTWTLISGSGTITTPTSPTSTVTALGLGANVFQWTITNPPCGTSTDQVTITSTGGPTTSAAGGDQTVCGTTASLTGNTATTGTGAWTLISGTGTITTPSSPTSGVTGLGVGPNVFQWTITSAPCPPSTDQVTITGVASPTVSAAGTDQSVCGTTTALTGNTATTGTGTWTLISGTGTITTPSSPTSGITALGVGPNVFQWTIANAPCPSTTDQVTITGVAAPTVSAAGTDQTVCSTSATLAGNPAATGTGTWTLISGTGTITTPSSPTSGVTGLGLGANVFQWTIANAPCPSTTDQVTITSTGGPTTSAAGGDQTVCGTTASLTGNTATTGTGAWTLISGTGTITTPSSPTSGVTGLGVGPNVFQWTITSVPCPPSTDQVTITGVASPTVSAAGTDQTVCGTTATLAGNIAATGTGTWTLISGTGTITTPSSPTSGLTALGVGPNVFQWTIANAPCPSTTDQVTITGVAAPTVSAAGTDQTLCGTTATLAGNAAATGTGTWTLISGSGTITTPSSPTSGVTGLGAGANVFQWTIANAPCPSSTDQVTITITPLADATITSVTPICIGTPAFNLSSATAGGTWTGTGITSGASGTFNPATAGTGTFTITYTIAGACGNVDTALVTVVPNDDATITPVSSLCTTTAAFNLTAATAGGTWAGTGITNSITGTFDPGSTAGIGSYAISYTTPGACGSTDSILINIIASFDATITQPATICVGSPAFNLAAATTGRIWTGIGITDTTNGTFNPTTAGVGVYVITYSISGTCGAMDTVSITVTPSASATIISVPPICADVASFNLSAVTAGGTWSGTGITDAINGTFNPSLATPGPNTITYSIGGACGDTATQTITVNALPTPTFTSDVTSGCAPLCVTFTEAASNTCNTMLYDFGDGSTSSSSTATDCYTNAGNYSVTITCTDLNGCIGTTTITNMITVFNTPVADFTLSPSGIAPVGSTIVFTDISTNGGNSLWDFGDPSSGSNTSSLSSDSHTYGAQGVFCITLISSNASCADTTRECITIADEATVFIPNIFSPNNDGTNDIFYFTTSSVKELSCVIYDRWGLKIAEWTAVNDAINGWDGRTTSGLVAPDGVYYYTMKANTLNNKVIEQNGFIHLLKEK